MSVLFNNDKTELIVNCDCGCDDTIHFKINVDDYEDYAIMTYLNGNYFRDQYSGFDVFKKKLKKIWNIIRNKDYHYSEICMSKEEFITFKDYINSIQINSKPIDDVDKEFVEEFVKPENEPDKWYC